MSICDYQDFIKAVDDRLRSLLAAGSGYLNREGLFLLHACFKVRFAAEFCPTANDLRIALETNDTLSEDELLTARPVLHALDRVANREEDEEP